MNKLFVIYEQLLDVKAKGLSGYAMTNLAVGICMKGWAHDILFEMGFCVGFTEVYGLH